MVNKPAADLKRAVVKILLAAGASERNATIVADHMVSAHLSGVDTHGVWHLPNYVKDIQAGLLVPDASPKVIRESTNSALVTGNWTFGQVAAKEAMGVAIAKAEKHEVAVVGLVQAHHIGRLGEYVEMAAAKGMISMLTASGQGEEVPRTAPFGGRKAVLGTNPMALGFPGAEEPPMIVDFATCAIAGTKVRIHLERKEKVPPGCLLDKDGNPSTDPSDFLSGGAAVPFGGHKGYALMMALEVLGRVFSGADQFAESDRGGVAFRHEGVSMIVLRADLFQPLADYAARVDELRRRVRAIPPAAGFREVIAPGDPEVRARTIRQRDGIPLSDDLWQKLTDLARSLGVEGL